MKRGKPSETAEWVARMRATHQVLDAPPRVLEDPFAVRILPAEQREGLSRRETAPTALGGSLHRAFVVARSRHAEATLARAVARGVRQYVILGAGLDTFACRNPHPDVHLFEVDHPDTQAWKRELLAEAALPHPPGVTFVPLDFVSQTLDEGLAAGGFQAQHPAFFSWLGVIGYLPLESFRSTLAFVGARPPGSGVVFDYPIAREELEPATRQMMDSVLAQVARMDEPLRLSFSLAGVARELAAAGLTDVENLDAEAIHARYFAHRGDGLSPRGEAGRLVSAWVRER